MVIPKNLVMVSAISYPPPNPHSFTCDTPQKTKDRKLPPEVEVVMKAMYKLMRLPNRIALMLGMQVFVGADKDNPGVYNFNIWGWPAVFMGFRIVSVSIIAYFFFSHREEYAKMFGGWGKTEQFSHATSFVTIVLSDIICSTLTMGHRENLRTFHSKLMSFIAEVTTLISSCREGCCYHGPSEYLKQLALAQGRIFSMVYAILVLFIVALSSSLYITIPEGIKIAEQEGYSPQLVWTLPFIVVFFTTMHTLRQVAYYGIISVFSVIWFGLMILRDLISREVTDDHKHLTTTEKGESLRGPDDQQKWETKREARIKKLLDLFKAGGCLIEQINTDFQWVLIVGTVTLMITILSGSFQFCIWSNSNVALIFASTLAGVVSNGLTFFALCTWSSAITKQAKLCMVSLRDLGATVVSNRALYQKILMWHMEGTVQPPSISPGYFFTLRRRLLPSVVAMMITYLLVLVQFQLKDELEEKARDGLQALTEYRNHT